MQVVSRCIDDAHLMRVAGHCARRLKAWAKAAGVPVIFSGAGHRKELISAAHLPTDPDFTGLFLVVVGRAPASVWHVEHTADGRIRCIERKRPWVNHYAFHIRDQDWGHVIVRFCPANSSQADGCRRSPGSSLSTRWAPSNEKGN